MAKALPNLHPVSLPPPPAPSGRGAPSPPSAASLSPPGAAAASLRRQTSELSGAPSLRHSLDSALPAAVPPPVPGSHSLVIPPPAAAASYSIALDSRFLAPGASFLSAALEQSLVGSQAHGGHLIASASAAAGTAAGGGAGRGGAGRLAYSGHMTAAERGAHLVARAKRSVPHPAGLADAPLLQRQLSPGAMYGTAMYGK